MITKLLEIRDRGTFIPVLAIQYDSETELESYLLARAGYGQTRKEQRDYIALCQIDGGEGKIIADPYEWENTRTMQVAHKYIKANWMRINSGDVVDVEFILAEKTSIKMPQRLEKKENKE